MEKWGQQGGTVNEELQALLVEEARKTAVLLFPALPYPAAQTLCREASAALNMLTAKISSPFKILAKH